MAGLVSYDPFEGLERRGLDVGFGEAIGAGFRIAKPRAGFNPLGKLNREIWDPFQKWLPAIMPIVGMERPGLARPLSVAEQTALDQSPPTISIALAERLQLQGFNPDEQTFTDLMSELTELGIDIPENATPEAIDARRAEIYARERENVEVNSEILSRAGAKTALAGQFIGGFGAELTDPANLATFVVGAPARFGIMATAATEGVVNAAVEGLQTPGRNEFLTAIGQEEEGLLKNMGFGFVFGGVFGGGIKAAKPAANLMAQGSRNAVLALQSRLSPSQRREVATEAAQSPDSRIQATARAVIDDLDDLDAGTANTPLVGDAGQRTTDPIAEREHNARIEEAALAGHEGRAPDMPDRPVFAVPAHSIINGTLEEVNAADLLLQPETFQFKSEGTGEGGSTGALDSVKQWDPRAAGVVQVFEYADGTRAIADGHQRVNLANRLMREDPSQNIQLAANVYREADGWTVAQVREAAALVNIIQAKDGMTSAMARDAAKVLRVNPDALENLPVGPGIARARELAALSDDAFGLVINDVVSENYGAMVGRMVNDPALHMSIMRLLERTDPRTAAQAESIISQALQAPTIKEKTVDLFGEAEVVESLFLERAKVLEKVMARVRSDRSVFRTLDERAGRIEGRGKNKLDRKSNRQEREQIEETMAVIQALAHRAGPISEALNNAATKYKETGNIKDAADTVVDTVRAEIDRSGIAGLGNAGSGRVASHENSQPATPDRAEQFDDPTGEGAKQQVKDTRIEVTELQQGLVDLQRLVDIGADRELLDNHPVVVEALEEINSRPETIKQENYGSEEWDATRPYTFDGEEVIGIDAALDRWVDGAKTLAWRETNQTPQPVKADRELTIVLGPPAAGKSTIANDIAVSARAAIVDPDEIKKTIPEFDNGIGSNAVHAESSELTKALEATIFAEGVNVVMPKVGKTAATIEATIARAREAGYSVRLVNMAVTTDNVYRRMIARFINTGRIIPPTFVDMVGDSPSTTFRSIKKKGLADGYAEIDNNVGRGEALVVTEREGDDAIGKTGLNLQEGRERPDADAPIPSRSRETSAKQPISEKTPEGDQMLIEGVAPIRAVDRLQSAQNKPLRGGKNAPLEDGLFGPNGGSLAPDLFDEVPVARTINGQDDPITEVMSRKDLADELDADDAFVEQLGVCLL